MRTIMMQGQAQPVPDLDPSETHPMRPNNEPGYIITTTGPGPHDCEQHQH